MEGAAIGPIGKPKFPEDHAVWTRKMVQQGFARIEAENAAKAEEKAEKKREKANIAESRGKEGTSTPFGDGSQENKEDNILGEGEIKSDRKDYQ